MNSNTKSAKFVNRQRETYYAWCKRWESLLTMECPSEAAYAKLWANWCKSAPANEFMAQVNVWQSWLHANKQTLDRPSLLPLAAKVNA